MNKAVFLDRDGIINKPIMREGKATSPRTLQEWQWSDGIHALVKKLKKAGFLILVVTNQPDVVRGLYPQATLEQFHQMIIDELQVDDLMVCMHDDIHLCHCRKPKPGMLLDLAKKWSVSMANSVFIGDTFKDMAAGKEAGCFRILVNKEYNQGTDYDYLADNLEAAAQYILENFQ